ncbi:MAG: pilus assembly protein PilM [Betaproteobacteria bacterium]
MERTSPELRQRLRNAAQRSGLAAFWQWWKGELAGLMPGAARTALRRRRLRPIVAFQSDAAVLWAPRVTDGTLAFAEVARIPLGGDAAELARAGHAAIGSLPRVAYGGVVTDAKVAVALPPAQVLRKTITLPAAVEENLHQTLAYDLDRHTPFKPEEVYFDALVVGRDAAKKEIRVHLAAALKSAVDQARRRVEDWGAAVVAVTPELPTDSAALGGTTLNLLPSAERPDATTWRRWEVWVPLALIAVLAVVATALPVWQKRGYAIALLKLADQGRVQADASSALRDELERQTGDYNFALQKKYAFPAALQVVEDVTRLLPDDTWLIQLEMKTTARGKEPRREIVLRGESANAGRLVSLFEDSKVFADAAPRSPTTKIQPGPGEVFDLGAQLKPLPLPQATQLADAVASGAGAAAALPLPPATPAAGQAAPGAPAPIGDPGAVPAAKSSAGPGTAAPPAKAGAAPPAAAPAAATGPAGAPAPPPDRAAEAPAPDAPDAPANGATKATP